MSTISTTINHGVTLGQPNYDSPLTVTSTGYVSNNGSGQAIYGSTGTVVNQGTLVATGASVFGKYSGIEIYGNGNAYNSGTIIAASNGIAIYAVGSVTNSGGISAQQWGVVGRGSFLDVSNTGTIYGADNGINLFSGGSVTNSGTIIGDNGVAISGDAGTVVNSGGITGTYQTGIALEAGGSVTNSAGGVVYSGGPYTGVYVAGGPGTILNSGTVDGSTGVKFSGNYGTFNDTLIDSGTIIGRGGNAVVFSGGTDLMQLLPGNLLIQGTVNGGGETSTLEFTSGASAGTLTGVGASFTNFGIGTVDAGASWVLAGNVAFGIGMTLANDSALTLAASGTLVNTGFITADLTSESIRGGGTAALLDNLGSIQAYNIGVDLQLGGTLINGASGNATALISANYGAYAASGLVSNYGTISASGTGSQSVLLGGAGQVSNHVGGLITGHNIGVDLSGGVATLINLGVVSAANNGVLALYNDDVLINGAGGLIAGTRAVVMATAVTTPVSDTLNNYGTITGQYGVIIGILSTTGTLHATIVDAGTIIGTGGTAIEALAAGPSQSIDLTLRLLAGNDFIQGTVAGYAGGTGVLDFASGSGTGTLTGSGADFINFQTASVDAGANWTFAGTNTLGANTTLVDAGLLTNIGTLVVDPPITVTGIFVNSSIVSAPGTYTAFSIASGGVLTNSTAGTITAGGDGAYGNTGTVVNQGSISAGNVGVVFSAAGTVSNASGATIAATNAGIVINGAGTVVNQGTITGTDPAGLGVDLTAGGTVVDSGLISGGADAIKFGGSSNLLVLENGYALSGAVYGVSGASNTLELLGTSAANAVTATYNTLGLTNFGTIAFAPGAGNYATLRITDDATLPGTIAGFTGVHDTIDLTGLSDAGNDATTSFDTLTNVLTVTGDDGSVQLQLDSEDYTGVAWQALNDGSNGTDVTPLCFCAGTVIATPEGDVPVERLGAGDLVVTMSGQVRPIAWIGTGRVLATRGRRNAATPVIVRKGSIAPNVPHSDLHVTKGHSLYLDGVLVPVEFLVNHRTILWDDHAQEVTLYHVELETHDVLLANGAPAESYRDDGNRWLFQNANAGWDQAPRPPCAEVLTGGPIVDAVWRRLLERAGPRPRQVLTDDPDLHVLVDGCRVDAARRTDAAYVFSLPVAVRSVRIASRAAAPAELGVARDPRVLGVALRRIVVRAGSRFRVVDLTDERLVEGFHGYESDGARRWTDGDAVLPVDFFRSFAGRTELVLHVDGATKYRADDRSDRCVA